jgi:hypothetical protein
MTLHALHDAATVARLAGVPKPACESLALSTKNPSEVLFSFVGENPLAPDWLVDLDLPGDRIACWSGTLDHEAVSRGDLFTAHPHNWMQPGAEALNHLLDQVTPGLERHQRTLCLIPHARHVLNDVQGSINLIRARTGSVIEVALAPTAMLTPSMLDVIEDHLIRSFETLAEHAPFLFLHDVTIDAEDERLLPAPLGSGVLDRDLMLRMIERYWPSERPIVILAGDIGEQTDWLSGA